MSSGSTAAAAAIVNPSDAVEMRVSRFSQSIEQFALSLYHSSLESGPEHIDTAPCYYLLGDAFLKRARYLQSVLTTQLSSSLTADRITELESLLDSSVESALAMFDKMIDLFYKFLMVLKQRQEQSLPIATPSKSSAATTSTTSTTSITDYLNESTLGESISMMQSVLTARQHFLGHDHIAVAENHYCLASFLQMASTVPTAAFITAANLNRSASTASTTTTTTPPAEDDSHQSATKLLRHALDHYRFAYRGYRRCFGDDDSNVESIRQAIHQISPFDPVFNETFIANSASSHHQENRSEAIRSLDLLSES